MPPENSKADKQKHTGIGERSYDPKKVRNGIPVARVNEASPFRFNATSGG